MAGHALPPLESNAIKSARMLASAPHLAENTVILSEAKNPFFLEMLPLAQTDKGNLYAHTL